MWPTPEQRFILSLLRHALGHESPGLILKHPSPDLAWQDIEARALHNGIAPLLHDALRRDSRIQVPAPFEETLEAVYTANLATTLLHERELRAMVARFEQAGVRCLVLKGLGLSVMLYPKPELRPCGGDLDILIEKEDYQKAKPLLEALGYRLETDLSDAHEIEFAGELRFLKHTAGKDVVVDLHIDFTPIHLWKVAGSQRKEFWDRLLRVAYDDFHIPCLPVDASLFYLAVHCAGNHIFDRLINFCDMDLLVRKYRRAIQWEGLGRFARENGARKILYHALDYSRYLLGTPVPGGFLDALKPTALSIRLLPTRRLLMRKDRPSQILWRYVNAVLLDSPRMLAASGALFLKRVFAEGLLKMGWRRTAR
jgi:hypothetical protein